MALMADFAASGVREHRGPSPWVAALLTVLTPGLGHLYIGQARRGITLFILILIADTLLMFAMMGVLARFWMFAISFMLLVGLWLYIVFDAIRRARRTPPLPDHGHSDGRQYSADHDRHLNRDGKSAESDGNGSAGFLVRRPGDPRDIHYHDHDRRRLQ